MLSRSSQCWKTTTLPCKYGILHPQAQGGQSTGASSYLKLFPEPLLGLLTVICHFVQLLHSVFNVSCIDARGIERLKDR